MVVNDHILWKWIHIWGVSDVYWWHSRHQIFSADNCQWDCHVLCKAVTTKAVIFPTVGKKKKKQTHGIFLTPFVAVVLSKLPLKSTLSSQMQAETFISKQNKHTDSNSFCFHVFFRISFYKTFSFFFFHINVGSSQKQVISSAGSRN